MNKKNKLTQFFLVFGFWLMASVSHKVDASISISELYPNPAPGESEWIELYNDATTSADLSGLILKDQLSTPSIIYQFENEIIEPLSYQAFFLTSNKLNNSTDGVTLVDQLGIIIDQMSYQSSTAELSWSKIENEWILTTPTINQPNLPPPSPSPTPPPTTLPVNFQQIASSLQISEVYYCPVSGETEWLELYNQSDKLIGIDDWTLIDQSGNQKSISLNINPKSLAIFEWPTGFLNNSGDTISIVQPNGETALKLSLPACQTNTSLIYDNSAWKLTKNVTKLSSNIFSDLEKVQQDQNNENFEVKKIITKSDPKTVEQPSFNWSMIPYPPNKIILNPTSSTASGQILGISQALNDFDSNQDKNLKKIWISFMTSAIFLISSSVLIMLNTKQTSRDDDIIFK